MIIDTSAEPEPQSRPTRTFRKYAPIVRFTPEQGRRQNDLLRSAWQSLKSRSAVIAFLNTHNDDLGGEPLSVAIASEEGLRSAERMLSSMHCPGNGTPDAAPR